MCGLVKSTLHPVAMSLRSPLGRKTGNSVAMDSTPTPTPTAISSATSVPKLPIKRKTADSNPNTYPGLAGPNVDPNSVSFPPISTFKSDPDSMITPLATDHQRLPPPFKFHRIWTEPDELRFLKGLLDCGSENFSFPRDLNIFYARFSGSMSQPYTKSQLSEKLRRLRKKYRVMSTRVAKGLDQSLLSPHDRALYQLSRQLWHPDFAESSPFGGGNNGKSQKSDLVGNQVKFLPTLPVDSDPNLVENVESHYHDDGFGEERLNEVNVEFEECASEEKMMGQIGLDNGKAGVAVKAIVDAFDESLKEVKKGFANEAVNKDGFVKERVSMWSFQRRWKEQRFAEMEALSCRMRLVFEHSLLQRQ